MYARSITVQGDVDRLDEGIGYVRDEVLPVLTERPGWVGLSMLVDRGTGQCIVTSSWDDEAAMRSSDLHLAPLRTRSGQVLGGTPVVEEWEVAVMHRAHHAREGACCRVAWLRTDHARVDRGIALYRTSLLPEMESLPGFCSASLLVDRAAARACSTTAYESAQALAASRDRAWALRETGAREVGVDVLDVVEMELVVAHLRLPELV
jgi:hypothetical protein